MNEASRSSTANEASPFRSSVLDPKGAQLLIDQTIEGMEKTHRRNLDLIQGLENQDLAERLATAEETAVRQTAIIRQQRQEIFGLTRDLQYWKEMAAANAASRGSPCGAQPPPFNPIAIDSLQQWVGPWQSVCGFS